MKGLLFVGIWGFALGACSTGPTKNTYSVRQLAPANLMVRRPPSVPASAQAGPGGTDYVSQPMPGPNMDCRETRSLADGLDLKSLRACFATVNQSPEHPTLRYRLQRVPQPFFELQKPDDAPECIRTLLSKIPVPREIFFQGLPTKLPQGQAGAGEERVGQDTGPYYDCYAASLDLTADEVMGVKVSKAKLDLEIEFPLKRLVLRTDEEALRVYLGWSIAPFFSQEKGEIAVPAKYVPPHICKLCMTEQRMLKTGDPLPLLWP